jgi:hypothetical protein
MLRRPNHDYEPDQNRKNKRFMHPANVFAGKIKHGHGPYMTVCFSLQELMALAGFMYTLCRPTKSDPNQAMLTAAEQEELIHNAEDQPEQSEHSCEDEDADQDQPDAARSPAKKKRTRRAQAAAGDETGASSPKRKRRAPGGAGRRKRKTLLDDSSASESEQSSRVNAPEGLGALAGLKRHDSIAQPAAQPAVARPRANRLGCMRAPVLDWDSDS